MKTFNICMAILAFLLVALIVLAIIRKEWIDVLNNVCWLCTLNISAFALNQANNMYEIAMYFIEHEEEKEDYDESEN